MTARCVPVCSLKAVGVNKGDAVGKGARARTGILLVHGLAGRPEDMRVLARSLSLQGYTVFVVTLAGHCGTRQALAGTRWLEWLASVRDGADLLASRVDRLFVGGIGMGAVLALALAQERPWHVAGVLALSPAFRHDGWSMPRCVRLPFMVPVLRALGIGPYRILPRNLAGDRDALSLPDPPWGAIVEMRKLAASVLRRMDMVRAPCLVIHALHDGVASVSNALDIVQGACHANVRVEWLASSRHRITTGHERRQVIARVTAFVNESVPNLQAAIPTRCANP